MNPLTLVKRIQKINTKEAELGISENASWHAKYKDSAYVFAGGIPFDLTEGDLLAVFAQYGEIVDVNLVRDKGTGKSKGFAFVAYEDQRSTNLAVDNLNGAQILGRIIRVDHVSNYKKKEEEDEETERKKREERGVCRAFQRGQCTRGAGCKFSHDEQRAANTGWGPEDASPKWGHDKFEGPKWGVKRSDNNPSNPAREPPIRDGYRRDDKDLLPRSRGSERALESNPRPSDRREEKRLRHDEEFEPKSKEDRDWREDRRSVRHNGNELDPKSRELKREEKRSRRHEDDEFQPNSREVHDWREEKRSRRHNSDEFEPKSREDVREEKRSRRPDNDDFETKSRGAVREEKWLKRHDDDDDGVELKSREDEREGKKLRRHESEYHLEEKRDKVSSSHHNRGRNEDRPYKSVR
ncbi:Zinc finger CCCH domain-containing protein 42 [Morella rubra]|uniref:Zinc finger CCCH domain-containing protein 42 n=1 Tax=Morella rubra TaxID=262757 RepID=A0A6A1VI20_9ROSI|nr:Zinc finger CCCH domain-containing protein 42 [Morella rubra]KAB1221801.1 Zinc finger CCCH domain-containing protein 42 [Morella rubra]